MSPESRKFTPKNVNTVARNPTSASHAEMPPPQPLHQPRVQVRRVDQPRDQRPGLLGIPAPPRSPGRFRPDGAEDERAGREDRVPDPDGRGHQPVHLGAPLLEPRGRPPRPGPPPGRRRPARYPMAATKLTTKNASPMKEKVTCRTSQKDRSAGMGGWMCVGREGRRGDGQQRRARRWSRRTARTVRSPLSASRSAGRRARRRSPRRRTAATRRCSSPRRTGSSRCARRALPGGGPRRPPAASGRPGRACSHASGGNPPGNTRAIDQISTSTRLWPSCRGVPRPSCSG